jgi:hypothetical protein
MRTLLRKAQFNENLINISLRVNGFRRTSPAKSLAVNNHCNMQQSLGL